MFHHVMLVTTLRNTLEVLHCLRAFVTAEGREVGDREEDGDRKGEEEGDEEERGRN